MKLNRTRRVLFFLILMSSLVVLIAARYRGGFNATEDSWVRNGADIIFYNGSGVNSTNETHRLDGAGGVVIAAPTAAGTATPALLVQNNGVGNSFEIRNSSGTPIVQYDNSGAGTFSGGTDLNGNALTIDADADTTLVASDDDVISTTLGAATGEFKILTGNLTVGNGTEDTALNGEDAYIEGTLEVDGATNFDGAADFASTVTIGGDITLENGETVSNATNNYITLTGGLVRSSTTITVTNGETITPTLYNGYRLNASSEVTITLAACSQDFTSLILYGEDAQTINIADSNIRTSDGAAAAVGQYDLWVGECVNSEWVEVANIANQ